MIIVRRSVYLVVVVVVVVQHIFDGVKLHPNWKLAPKG